MTDELTLETPALQNSRLQLSLSLTLMMIIIEVKEVGINVTNNARVKEKCVSIKQTT